MRKGTKPVAMRHRLALHDCPEAVIALQEGECALAGITPPDLPADVDVTEEDLKDEALELLRELRQALAKRVVIRKREQQVLRLLRSGQSARGPPGDSRGSLLN